MKARSLLRCLLFLCTVSCAREGRTQNIQWTPASQSIVSHVMHGACLGAFDGDSSGFLFGDVDPYGVIVSDSSSLVWKVSNLNVTGGSPALSVGQFDSTFLIVNYQGFLSIDHGASFLPFPNRIPFAIVSLSRYNWKQKLLYTFCEGSYSGKTRAGIRATGTVGRSWIECLPQPFPDSSFYSFGLSNAGVIFTTTGQLLTWRTRDFGLNWTLMDSFPLGVSPDSYSFDRDDNLYIGTDFGVYKSTDTGNHFTRFDKFFKPPIPSGIHQLIFDPDGDLFVRSGYRRCIRTTDNGATFLDVAPKFRSSSEFGDLRISNKGVILFAGDSEIFISKHKATIGSRSLFPVLRQ